MTLRPVALCALLWAVLAGTALAIDAVPAFDDPVQQARYERINRELRCLQCQNQTIADSDAPLAADLRREVHAMMQAGRTDAEIRQFMLDRYGDFVLYRPRMSAANFLLWAAPVLLLAIGSFVALRFIRRRTAETYDDGGDPGAGRA
jgi:cytochrome c-type biogenesis protein CcmH